jgi:hypothetical protein
MSMPKRRECDLVIENLKDEILVYDERSAKIHCLNGGTAVVFRHCDGRTSISKMAEMLCPDPKASSEAYLAVGLALAELGRLDLVCNIPDRLEEMGRTSRRDFALKFGTAVGLVPAVMSVMAPSVAMAASCGNENQICCSGDTPCNSGLGCCSKTSSGNKGKCVKSFNC